MAAFDVRSGCIVLLLDRAYLHGAHVLIDSLRQTFCLARSPVVILSDDPEVLGDPGLLRRSARQVLIGQDFVDRYAALPREQVPEKLRRASVPKYTWLKFALFQDFGFPFNICFDADMLALQPLDGLFDSLRGLDFDYAAAPNIQRTIWERERSADAFALKLRSFLDSLRPLAVGALSQRAVSFNSGFSVIGPRLMQPAFIDRLFARAAEGGTQYEQRIVNDVLRRMEARFCEIPVWANVTRPIYDQAAAFGMAEICRQVLIHHYIFRKPWDLPEAERRPSDRIWWDAAGR